MRKPIAVLLALGLALPAFALSNRRNTLLVNSGNKPAFASGYKVIAYDIGALVSASSSGTVIAVHAGHGFAATDKLMVGTNTSKFRTVQSVTSTSITVDSAVSVSTGDYIINLGADTGVTGAPNYNGSTVTAYSDMAGDGTYTNAQVTTNTEGVYTYWFSVSNLWELVRNSSGVPVAIIPEVNQTGGGGGGGSTAFSSITSGTSTNTTMTVGNASIISTSGSGSIQATSVPGSGVSGAVATATALAANGANCTSPTFPLGVDASGAAETCTTVLLPSAATMNTGVGFTASNFGVTYTASDTNPSCAAGEYKVYADLSETKIKKCVNGVVTDADTTGGTPTFDTIGSGTNTSATMVCGSGCSATVSGTGIREATKFKGSGTTTDAVDLATGEVAGTLAQSNGGTGATSFTAGRVIFEGASANFTQDADLTFDGTQTLTAGTFSSPDQDGTNAVTIIGNTSTLAAASSGQARIFGVGRTTSVVPHWRDNATGDEQVLTTNRAATAGSASAITFAAAASLAIPSAANPTVDAAGEIAQDTTASQIVHYDGTAVRVIPYVYSTCAVIENLAAADDNFEFWMTNAPVTITSVGCRCRGTCSTMATFTLEDRGGNAMTITGTNPTCATTGNATYAAVTAANQLVAGEGLAFDVTNTPNPDATDEYTICVAWTADRQ